MGVENRVEIDVRLKTDGVVPLIAPQDPERSARSLFRRRAAYESHTRHGINRDNR